MLEDSRWMPIIEEKHPGFRIKFYIGKELAIDIYFNVHQKRIGLRIWNNRKNLSTLDIYKTIEKAHNIFAPGQRNHNHCCNYDFKHSPHNCKRIVQIITTLVQEYI